MIPPGGTYCEERNGGHYNTVQADLGEWVLYLENDYD